MTQVESGEFIEQLTAAMEKAARAKVVWGDDRQIAVAMEEMAELTQAICRKVRGRSNDEGIREEIADVLIVTLCLVEIFGPGACTAALEKKLMKVEGYLQASEK
jgi:NTP pyrophosphatase (non-canonical NTP hydrolase)